MLYYILFFMVCFSPLYAQESITVIGIGRLGLCAALSFENAGYNVMGVDINPSCVAAVNNKTLQSSEPLVNDFLQKSINFKATCSFDEGLNFADIYYIMVDTPSTTAKEAYDHSKLGKVLTEINKRKVKNKHIVIGCTVNFG